MLRICAFLLIAASYCQSSESFSKEVKTCNPNPCIESYCSLDQNLKPICHCPLGFHGKNCSSSKEDQTV